MRRALKFKAHVRIWNELPWEERGKCIHLGEFAIQWDLGYKETAEMYLSGFPKDSELDVTLGLPSKPNTRAQQKYYRRIVHVWAEYRGWTDDEMHRYIGEKYFLDEDENGHVFIRTTAIGEWDRKEFADVLTQIEMDCRADGADLEPPDQAVL